MAEQQSLTDLVRELAEQRGIDLRGYKPGTLERRIRRRMHQLKLSSYAAYLNYVKERPDETVELLDTVLINVTRFFRDPLAWEVLAQALPKLFRDRPSGSQFRVWCAGCSTGEEAYSVAILLCEALGPRVNSYDVKIYGTDQDEKALAVARQARYDPERLHGVSQEIKDKYFTGSGRMQVVRPLRRKVIFGRGNLLADAPIPHVDLLLCRNVLIYFDVAAQAQILKRLQYALSPGGVLFLGKSEPQLKRDGDFATVDSRWRIFQRRSADGRANLEATQLTAEAREKSSQELAHLQLYYESVLSTLEPGVLILDAADKVITENDKVAKLWGFNQPLVGKALQDTQLWERCADLKTNLEASRKQGPQSVRFQCQGTGSTVVLISIKPILSPSGAGQVGTLIYMENVTSRVSLQSALEELETTSEELQATNEELETTNEEMQSTNEELETTNEELQSTNEELETTNEELQSLNEELETTNEELTARTRELDQVNARYAEMMEQMPWPVLLVNDDAVIHMFNSAAQKLFGFAQPSEQGMRLEELPLDRKSRQAIERRHRSVADTHRQSNILQCHLTTNRFDGVADVRLSPLSAQPGHGVIVMFQIGREDKSFLRANERPGKKKPRSRSRASSSAKKKKSSRKRK